MAPRPARVTAVSQMGGAEVGVAHVLWGDQRSKLNFK